MEFENKENLSLQNLIKPGYPRWLKVSFVFFLILFILTGICFGSAAIYIRQYQNKIYSGIYVGHYHLGEMTRDDLNNFIENLNNRLAKEGINLKANANSNVVDIKINTVLSEENSMELIKLDSYALWQQAYVIGRNGSWFKRLFTPLIYRFNNQHFSVPIKTDWVSLLEILKGNLSDLVDAPRNAGIKVTSFSPLAYEIIPESSGLLFSYEDVIKQIQDNLSQLNFGDLVIYAQSFAPSVLSAEAQKAVENLSDIVGYGDIGLNYIDSQTKLRRDWSIPATQYTQWLAVEKDEEDHPIIVLNGELTKTYLESLRYLVDRPARDAKFAMAENNKVKEFQSSQTGLTLNVEKTFNDLNVAFKERNYHQSEVTKTIGLTVDSVDPMIKMAAVNDLGIEDIIGAGYSTFKDSHTNRIKNIAHAVDRLNGTLIKPGEEFSALKYAGPFTAENGYLPEAVIKGNEIKNEIGGGMCQIGTTLFRMAMNSGMDITQRQNHSLVVSYYADPVNGNPGTDAALYEPMLDLKFKNDTGNYLLLQTEIDYKKQQLTFTLWGKPDGRQGFYTHPLVKKWIPYGEPQEIISDKLESGEEKCQVPYRGAVATFTYTRITPTGEKIDRIFDSYYRPLPKICLVGKTLDAGLNVTSTISEVMVTPN